jgi:hypothetical protein
MHLRRLRPSNGNAAPQLDRSVERRRPGRPERSPARDDGPCELRPTRVTKRCLTVRACSVRERSCTDGYSGRFTAERAPESENASAGRVDAGKARPLSRTASRRHQSTPAGERRDGGLRRQAIGTRSGGQRRDASPSRRRDCRARGTRCGRRRVRPGRTRHDHADARARRGPASTTAAPANARAESLIALGLDYLDNPGAPRCGRSSREHRPVYVLSHQLLEQSRLHSSRKALATSSLSARRIGT